MREIKFRAWNSDFNWFEENFFIGAFDGCGYDAPGRAFDTPNIEIEEQPNYIIEQFTGLKDCNGTDIYEGDIISWGGIALEVKFIVDGWFAETIDKSITEAGQEWEYTCVVVGNIHQHAYLLEQNKC